MQCGSGCVVDRTAGEVCSGVINKCLNQRAKTKDLGMAVLMMFIEIEKQDIVQVSVKDAYSKTSCCCHPVDISWLLGTYSTLSLKYVVFPKQTVVLVCDKLFLFKIKWQPVTSACYFAILAKE